METTLLDKDMIAQPELWRLMLSVSDSALDVALYPPTPREEMIWRSFAFDEAAPSRLKAIEDIVYDNSLLLSDFKSVGCVVDCGVRVPMPASLSAADALAVLSRLYPDDVTDESHIELFDTGCADASMALVMEPELKAFLSRTFFRIHFVERKAAICRYLVAHPEGMSACRLCAFFHNQVLTVIVIDGDRLLMANDFRYRTAADAAYYILASMQTLRLDATATDVTLWAQPDAHDRVDAILKRFVANVRSIPFPMLRYRVSKHTLEAPFDLLISTQCE